MAKLKVFVARIGFYDTAIAVPSKKAALEAWGVKADLFAEGTAAAATDKAALEAALARPGVLLRRAAGSDDPFRVTPTPPALSPRRARPADDRGPKPPSRKALTAAERALATLAERQGRERQTIQTRIDDLQDRLAELTQAQAREISAAEKAVAAARRRFIDQGGEP